MEQAREILNVGGYRTPKNASASLRMQSQT
jgi:hypothetical protein